MRGKEKLFMQIRSFNGSIIQSAFFFEKLSRDWQGQWCLNGWRYNVLKNDKSKKKRKKKKENKK